MSPVTKFEAIGIFVSVATMAMALTVLRFNSTILGATVVEKTGEDSNQAALVVAAQDTEEGETAALAVALKDSLATDGELVRLVIDDVKIGTGDEVTKGKTVSVHYIGTTRDGVKFDSSYDRGLPFSFTVGAGEVIKGWEEGLVGMKVGGQRILVIPADMAYGNRQVGPIPPNTPLVFAIELLEVN